MSSKSDRISPETPLIPSEPLAQALTEQWISMVNDVIDQTMIREYALSYLRPARAGRPLSVPSSTLAVPKLERQLAVLDEAVSETGFLVGSQLTFADINLMPILSSISRHTTKGEPPSKPGRGCAPTSSATPSARASGTRQWCRTDLDGRASRVLSSFSFGRVARAAHSGQMVTRLGWDAPGIGGREEFR